MNDTFYVATDISKMSLVYIHDYLCNHSYWAKGRTLEKVKLSMDHSLCFGVFNEVDKQVGFARIVTDKVVFAWIMDVFIDKKYRGQGLGVLLMEYIMDHPDLQAVNGIGLRTHDAHTLYEKFGFGQIDDVETWMIKKN
ncbi:MAG: GNAT family N-acetyltransferase [Saonia sp.]